MGGEGSIMGMIISYRDNMRKRRKKSLFEKDRTFNSGIDTSFQHSNQKIEVKKLDEQELSYYREKTIRSRRINQKKKTVIIFIITVPLLFGIYKIVSILNLNGEPEPAIETLSEKEKKEKYTFYLIDADKWASEKSYDNAIYQYKSALSIYPDDYIANYRLARVYIIDCKENQENCNEALSFLNKLIHAFPAKASLYELRAEYYLYHGFQEKASQDYEKSSQLSRAD